jgi:hypothetical protein
MISTLFFWYHILQYIPEYLNLPQIFSEALHVISSKSCLIQFSRKTPLLICPWEQPRHAMSVRGTSKRCDFIQICFIYALICCIGVACFVFIYLYCCLLVVDKELPYLPRQMIYHPHPLPPFFVITCLSILNILRNVLYFGSFVFTFYFGQSIVYPSSN